MKRNKQIFEENYNEIMRQVSRSVRSILERLDEDELEECYEDEDFLYEMARKKFVRTIDEKIQHAVYDLVRKKILKNEEVVNYLPKGKMDKEGYLNRYVAFLVQLNIECPKSYEDGEKIEVFKLYLKNYLDLGGTFEELEELYYKQEKDESKMKFIKDMYPGSYKHWFDNEKKKKSKKNQEIEDFDAEAKLDKQSVYDEEPEEEIVDIDKFEEPEDIEEPVLDPEEDDEVLQDILNDEPEEPKSKKPFKPSILDDDDEDDEQKSKKPFRPSILDDDDDDFPAYDEVNTDDEDSNINEYGEIISIENLNDLTYEDWMDPKFNYAFTEWDEKLLVLDENRNIGLNFKWKDLSGANVKFYDGTIWARSFGELAYKIKSGLDALTTINAMYIYKIDKLINNLFKHFYRNVCSEEQHAKQEEFQSNLHDDMDDIIHKYSKKSSEECFKKIEELLSNKEVDF